jgi:SAM-dependent methyltransferase
MSPAPRGSGSSVKASVQRQFGANADHYILSGVHNSGPDLQVMVEAARLGGAERVLDLGSGAGHSALACADGAACVIGVDLTPEMVAAARRLAQERARTNVRFEPGDVEQLPFEDQSFDRVITRYAFHHFPRPAVALAEARRVLRTGGLFLLADSVAPEDDDQDAFLHRIEVLRDPSHVRDHRVSELCQMLLDAGFLEPECLGRWSIELEFDDWTRRMRTPPERVAQIKQAFARASPEVQEVYGYSGGESWRIPAALLRARG